MELHKVSCRFGRARASVILSCEPSSCTYSCDRNAKFSSSCPEVAEFLSLSLSWSMPGKLFLMPYFEARIRSTDQPGGLFSSCLSVWAKAKTTTFTGFYLSEWWMESAAVDIPFFIPSDPLNQAPIYRERLLIFQFRFSGLKNVAACFASSCLAPFPAQSCSHRFVGGRKSTAHLVRPSERLRWSCRLWNRST